MKKNLRKIFPTHDPIPYLPNTKSKKHIYIYKYRIKKRKELLKSAQKKWGLANKKIKETNLEKNKTLNK